MEGVILGSGGWIPTNRRETCSALLRDNDDVLIIDAGTGLRRLIERPDLLAGAENVHIVLTHFHLDHVVGLSYLPALQVECGPVVWGPGERLYATSTRAILERLLAPPLFAATLDALVADVRELSRSEVTLDSFTLGSRAQKHHSDPTLALRVDDVLTYCTDTAPDSGNVSFAASSRLLLHEAWYAANATSDAIHSAAGDAGRIACEADVERLLLIHIHPLESSDQALKSYATREFPRAEVGLDLAQIPLC